MKIVNHPHAYLSLDAPKFSNPRRRGRGGRPVDQDDPETRELALHIGRHGLSYPLRITPEGTILGGQRRYLAIDLVIRWAQTLADQVAPDERATFEARARELAAAVPCVVREGGDPADLTADALADNLQRKEMASYDVAETIMALLEPSDPDRSPRSQAWIAREIGRSPTYVSRMVATWKNAIPALHDAWAADVLPYETVRGMAEQDESAQAAALASGDTKPRGGHGRPGIDAVKDALARIRDDGIPPAAAEAACLSLKSELDPVSIACEVLGWVAGERPRSAFVAALLGLA